MVDMQTYFHYLLQARAKILRQPALRILYNFRYMEKCFGPFLI